MRFTSFIVAGVFAVAASAQSSTAAVTGTSVTSASPSQSAALTEIQECLAQCDPTDTKCRANCIAVPSPDNNSVIETTKCVADCPQGSGSASDNLAYGRCVDDCIAKYYFTSTGTPNAATSKAGNSDSSSSSPAVTHVPTTITSGGSTFVSTIASTASDSSDGPSTTSSSDSGAGVYGPAGTLGAGLSLFGLLAGFIAL